MRLDLTKAEARLLYAAVKAAWIPSVGYADFRSALKKLERFVDPHPESTQETRK